MKIVEQLSLKVIALAFLLSLCCFQTGEAQTISLDEYLVLVKQNHPFFAGESLSVDLSIESQARFLGDRDWLIESSPFFSYEDRTGLYNTTYNKSSQVQLNGSLQKRVWKTGGRFSMSYTSAYSDQDYRSLFSGNPTELFRQQLSVTYSHPFLKNQGGVLDRLEYELAAYAIDFTEVQSQENQENFLLNAGISFLDWILMEEQLRINKERLLLAEEEFKSSRDKFEAHLIDKVDVLRQEDALRIAEQNVVLSQSLASAKQTELATLAQSPSIAESKPEYDIYTSIAIGDTEEVIGRLNAESRLLHAIDILVDQTTLKTKGLASQKRPQLDLNIGTVLIEDDESLGRSFGVDNPSLFLGLQFAYPLGNHTNKADIKKSEIELQQLKKDQESVFLDLEASIRGITIQIKEMEKVLELNLEQIESAQERTLEETKIYEQGRGDMTFVIQGQDNEANARLTYLQNAVAYHKLVLRYRALLDQLLDTE